MFNLLKNKIKNWTERIKKEIFHKEEKKEPEKRKKERKKKEEKKTKSDKTLEEKKEKTSFFSNIFKKELDENKFNDIFKDLEIALLENNVAFEVVEKIKKTLFEKLVGKKDYDVENELRKIIEEVLIEPQDFITELKNMLKTKKPVIIALFGVNGTGKTTTAAKIANLLLKNKISVCIAAADTYRAASIEQLEIHGKNLGIHIIKKNYGADPASVGYEAIQYAKKSGLDTVIIDTAGRLNNKESLMKELEKIIRVTSPDIKIFVGESITGNDVIEQAKSFNERINITGTVLTKADVDEKGGAILSVGYITKKPIIFLGTGQDYGDIESFDKKKIIEKLGI